MRTLAEIDAALRALACRDGGCRVLRPTGMHTNGGCHCLDAWESDYRETLRRAGQALVLHQERAAAIRADERAKVEAEVVAYIRRQGDSCNPLAVADRVERGEHRPKKGSGR